jgi:hypothetical protein
MKPVIRSTELRRRRRSRARLHGGPDARRPQRPRRLRPPPAGQQQVWRHDISFPAAAAVMVSVPRPVPAARAGGLGVGNVHGARARRGGRLGRPHQLHRHRRRRQLARVAAGLRPEHLELVELLHPHSKVADGELPAGSEHRPSVPGEPYLYRQADGINRVITSDVRN